MRNYSEAVDTTSDGVNGEPLTKSIPFIASGSEENKEIMCGKDFHLTVNDMAKKYGPVYGIETKKTPLVALSGYETLREALITQNDVFNIRADFEILKTAPQKHFLEFEIGETWKVHRKAFATAMRDYFKDRWEMIEEWLITEIDEMESAWIKQGEVEFDPNREVSIKLSSFLHKVMYGQRFGEFEKSVFDENALTWLSASFVNSTRYELMSETDKESFYDEFGDLLEAFPKIVSGLDGYVSSNVKTCQESYKADEYRHLCDYLISANNAIPDQTKSELGLSDREIIMGSLSQLAGAGGGVGALAFRWAALYLASYPELQAKVHEELDRVVGRENPPLQSHKGELHYTYAFISEVLRHCSIVATPAANYALSKDTVLNGYFIEKGTPLIINSYSLTRDESLWDKPDEFNPERFLNSDGQLCNRQLSKSFPFGIGQRRCIGEFLGTFIINCLFTNLTQRFKYSLPEGQEINLKAISGVFLIPEKVNIIATPR